MHKLKIILDIIILLEYTIVKKVKETLQMIDLIYTVVSSIVGYTFIGWMILH